MKPLCRFVVLLKVDSFFLECDVMRRVAILAGMIWVISLGAVLIHAETRPTSPGDAGAIFGSDTGWCRKAGACNAFNATCNSSASCQARGDTCGVTREVYSPESCDPVYGNQYCNTGETVEVICAKEFDCVCMSAVPLAGARPTLGCNGGNDGGQPGRKVAGSIETDSLNCAFEAKP